MVTTCAIWATSCTRTMAAPCATDQATVAAVPKARPAGSGWLMTVPINPLRLVPTSMGPQVHGKVREWTRVDQKAVHSAFMRLIVPGRNLYPTKVRHVPGKDDRTATVKVNGWHIEFHDHGEYSEILLPRSAQLPVGLCGALVSALGRVGGHELNWVYREIHENRQRCITARALPKPAELRPGHDGNFDAFWRDYAGELQALVA